MGRINESIWGAENTWAEVTEYNKPLGKVATFTGGGHKLIDGINNNNLTFNRPIDDYSLSWCGMGSESNYTKMCLFDANTYEPTAIKTQTPLNFMFYYVNGGVGPQYYRAGRNQYNQILYNGFDPGDTFGNLNNNKNIQPFTDFYIKDCVWLVKVDCLPTLTTTTISTFDFDDYKTNRKTTHPYILHIYAVPYFGAAGSRSVITTNMSVDTCIGVAPFNSYSLFSYPIGENFYQDFALTTSDRRAEITLFGSPQQNFDASNYYLFSVGKCKRKTTSPRRTYQDENIDDVLESALKTIACFGLFFVLDSAYIQAALDNNNVYMGVIPADYITHGEYTRGQANRENLNWNLSHTSESRYNPTTTDNTNYNNTTGFNAPTVAHSFTKRYVLNAAGVQNLAGQLWAAVNTQGAGVETSEFNNKLFLTNNPIDCIISLQKFPLSDIGGGEPEFIRLGAYETNVRGRPHTNTLRVIPFRFDPANANGLREKFGGSFLDREPYTTAVLYVPYCGTVQLDPADYMEKVIDVYLIIDYVTGACAAYIAADGLVMTTLQGSCAIELPVTGVQETTLRAQIFNANQQLKSAKMNRTKANVSYWAGQITNPVGVGASGGDDVGGVLSSIAGAIPNQLAEQATMSKTKAAKMNVQNAQYNINHMTVPFKEIGGASPCTSAALESVCRIIVTRPITKYDPTIYGHTVGYLCNITGTIGNFHGYAEITGADLSAIPCTEDEKTMIKAALETGVYLP